MPLGATVTRLKLVAMANLRCGDRARVYRVLAPRPLGSDRIASRRFTAPKLLACRRACRQPSGAAPLNFMSFPEPAVALEIAGLFKRFDRPAVNGFDLAVRTGEFYALLGPNGAGKTTILRM